jgi:hypothetical protein
LLTIGFRDSVGHACSQTGANIAFFIAAKKSQEIFKKEQKKTKAKKYTLKISIDRFQISIASL